MTPPFSAGGGITPPQGAIAVIFISGRTAADAEGYGAAADAMAEAAARQDGYLGVESARGADGLGITVSWWRDEAAALAWRQNPEHTRIREQGRALWYDWYRTVITTVERAYDWQRSEPAG
ncbi:antibiotic biosynthesis monooxygenase family protein [Novosphingobium terrae]|uniref:antibiotic biosynthesis monooxygenase family protein n=1 Tax=Novosphingobium terrae TaxID=2726189 RepID=UPI00197E8648|nr:antibiotic biosynthesis monooxygenase [Novosphingobium terrae]